MKRKIERDLEKWKEDPKKKPLIMIGCRQVGKTYTIREFLRSNYEDFIEINLKKEMDARLIFQGSLSSAAIIDKLLFYSDKKLVPGKTAIFLDEIQACPGAYSSLKWLEEDGRFDIIASGSFLGTMLSAGDGDVPISPLGYVNTMVMYPMDFEEYLWAMGMDQKVIDHAKESIRNHAPIDSFYDKLLRNHFLRFLIVGGMPASVKAYSETKDYSLVKPVIRDILNILMVDVGKYSDITADKMKIIACMESIPSQLASDKRRFQFQDIEKKSGGRRRYGDALDWLISAGMAYRCSNLRSVDPPLSQNMKETMFKVYMCDTGLLLGMMGGSTPGAIITSDPFSNNGIVMENAVAAELVKKGYPLYYYAKEGSTLEIDFVMDNGPIQLVEVKSGRNKRSKSLNTLLSEKHRNREGIKICDGNVEMDDKGALHLPLYGACFLPEPLVDYIPPVEEIM